ncbi:hypothetical protein KJ644_03445 [Candidatus Dependentiae bacterium]|nr:hypothetical protein [Candidatus Dependentiae bacterium]MBU4387501.1 hypothetical protein [Candidatus Dependentiae bacterium]MCG2756305.1 hypothetical protein [Candidatus Dependentiae bacterium]
MKFKNISKLKFVFAFLLFSTSSLMADYSKFSPTSNETKKFKLIEMVGLCFGLSSLPRVAGHKSRTTNRLFIARILDISNGGSINLIANDFSNKNDIYYMLEDDEDLKNIIADEGFKRFSIVIYYVDIDREL